MEEAITGFQYLKERVETNETNISLVRIETQNINKTLYDHSELLNEFRTHFRWIKGLGTSSIILLIAQAYFTYLLGR